MATYLEMEWTYEHKECGQIVIQLDVFLDVRVTGGAAWIDNVYVPADGNGFVSLNNSDTAFGKALYANITTEIEGDGAFEERALELARDAA